MNVLLALPRHDGVAETLAGPTCRRARADALDRRRRFDTQENPR